MTKWTFLVLSCFHLLRTGGATDVISANQEPPFKETQVKKDCYEYLYGHLKEIRRHGSTWQNGDSDCGNCTCDNGDIRCFIHFCNGPQTAYISHPSAEEELEFYKEESSGQLPGDYGDDDGSSKMAVGDGDPANLAASPEGSQNGTLPYVNSPPPTAFFCSSSCDKICGMGFKVDPRKGCYQCSCNACPHLALCTLKCTWGFTVDENGCQMCECFSEISNEDIIFKEDGDGAKIGISVVEPSSQKGDNVPPIISVLPGSTEPRGCVDGVRKFRLGERWIRTPCISCNCMGPGYAECNITECLALNTCTGAGVYTPTGACCPVCKGDRLESASGNTIFPGKEKHLERSFLEDLEDDVSASIKSVSQEEQSHLFLVFIPLGIILILGIFVSARFWRRYRRDKYYLSSFVEEETQKLRPVKTVADAGLQLKENV